MTRTSQLLGAVSVAALATLSASPALAAGTDAGTSITNNVTVRYQVGGIDQTDETASDTFVVDRKVNITVAESGGSATTVTPGATDQATKFTVTNLTNDVIDVDLSAVNQDGGAAAHTGTDNFDTTGAFTYYLDDGEESAGVFDPSDDTAVTYLEELPKDASVTVFVVAANIPGTVVTGNIATVVLTVDAHLGGTDGYLGAELTNSATNDAATVDTVLTDGVGETDSANNGDYSAIDDYIVFAADLSVVKSSRIISDGFSDTAPYKAIPGAVVEYCIAVTNAPGSATATSITVSDTLPANTTFVASSIKLNGTVDDFSVCSGGEAGGTFAGGDVTGSLSDITAGNTRTLVFQAKID